MTFDEAMAEVEAAAAEWERADPDDLEHAAGLLERRRRGLTAAGSPADAEQAARLGRVWESGRRIEERLKLAAAGTRHQLRELHRAGWHARALAAELGPRPPGLDLEA